MTQIAPELVRLHRADEEVVLVAVLLHDYAGIKDAAMVNEHHIHSAAQARAILTEVGYPEERIIVVEESILDHRSSAPGIKASAEARCVADCDAIAHLKELPSLFYVAYVERQKDIDAGAEWIHGKIQRDWDKLSPIGKDYIRTTYEAAMRLLSAGGS